MISIVVGLVLAVAYHVFSMWVQRWSYGHKFMMLPVVTIAGFIVRLAVIGGILVALGLWSPLNILAVCLAFVVLFTVLNGIRLYSLVTKQRGAPPSEGATGAK